MHFNKMSNKKFYNVNFELILKVYDPMWFRIKLIHFIHLSQNFWKTMQFLRYIPDNFQKIIDPVIKRNAYFASPENVFICVSIDDRKNIGNITHSKIINAGRNNNEGLGLTVLKFHH